MITKSPGQCDKGSLSLSSAATQEKVVDRIKLAAEPKRKSGSRSKWRNARRKANRRARKQQGQEIKVWRAK